MKTLAFFIALFFYLSPQPINASEIPWIIWKKNSVQSVKYRPVLVENKELIEITASTTVNSSLSGFLHFLLDVSNTANWLVNANESQIINRYSDTENSFYITLTKLWPLQSRILILRSSYWQNDDLSVDITIKDLAPALIKQAKVLLSKNLGEYVRVKTHSAHWKIIPKYNHSSNQVELFVQYIYIADGNGSTPKWLAEHFALKAIWKSMRNIRRNLPKEKWQQQSIKGITELADIALLPPV